MHIKTLLLVAPILLLSSLAEGNSNIVISAYPSRVMAGSEISLSGPNFGAVLGSSKVIADYGHGFFYVLKHTSWSNHTITLKVPDLGKSLRVKLRIQSANQRSNSVTITIKPDIRKSQQKEIKKVHVLNVGDKGEDIFKVVNKSGSCGKAGELFDHAEIRFVKKRFSEAQFVSLPAKGCTRCGDIRVRWYNEPTGKLEYRMSIFQRRIEGVCEQRVWHH